MTGHVWMMKSEVIFNGVKSHASNAEIVAPIIYGIWDMGLKVYCASDIYLKHISLDGKIYRRSIYDKGSGRIKDKRRLKKWEESMGIRKIERREKKPNELEEYLTFVKKNLTRGLIPDRPRKGERTTDHIHNTVIGQDEWDKYYGKWREFIEKGPHWALVEIRNKRSKL